MLKPAGTMENLAESMKLTNMTERAPTMDFQSRFEEVSDSNEFYRAINVDREHTRLLYLHLSNGIDGCDERVLEGTLKPVALASMPKYVALSYEWERSTSVQLRYLNCTTEHGLRYSIPLTPACYRMLHQICQKFGPIVIWIDAICINQNNQSERELQVSNMGNIYAQADSVLIWLGQSTPATDFAMTALAHAWRLGSGTVILTREGAVRKWADRIMRHYIFNLLFQQTWDFSGQGFGLQSVILRCVLDTFHMRRKHTVQHLESILGLSWRSRAWTFQELLLARNPVFMCGDKILGWPNLVFALGYARAKIAHGDIIVPSFEHWQALAGLWATVDWYRRHYGDEAHIRAWSEAARAEDETLIARRSTWKYLRRLWIILSREIIYRGRVILRLLGQVTVLLAIPLAVLSMRFMQIIALLVWNLLILFLPLGLPGVFIWLGVKKRSIWPIFVAVAQLMIEIYLVAGRQPRLAQCVAYNLDMSQHRFHLPSRDIFAPLPGPPNIPEPERPDSLPRKVLTPPGVVFKAGIIEALRERKATDPRDKAYSLHSILDRTGNVRQTVDYERPVPLVYENLFGDLLRLDSDMIRLILDAGIHSDSDQCSWVPDWSDNGWRTWLEPAYFRYTNEHTATPPHHNIDMQHAARVDEQGCLRLHVKFVAVVKVVAAVASSEPAAISSVPVLATNGGEDALQSFLHLLLLWLMQIPESSNVFEIQEVLYGSFARHRARDVPLAHGLRICMDYVYSCKRYEDSLDLNTIWSSLKASPASMSWLRRVAATRGTRNLFTTDTDSYGTGPLTIRSGDRVALVHQVPVPLVFRRCQTYTAFTYRLIGPACLAGAMAGELWHEHDKLAVISLQGSQWNTADTLPMDMHANPDDPERV